MKHVKILGTETHAHAKELNKLYLVNKKTGQKIEVNKISRSSRASYMQEQEFNKLTMPAPHARKKVLLSSLGKKRYFLANDYRIIKFLILALDWHGHAEKIELVNANGHYTSETIELIFEQASKTLNDKLDSHEKGIEELRVNSKNPLDRLNIQHIRNIRELFNINKALRDINHIKYLMEQEQKSFF